MGAPDLEPFLPVPLSGDDFSQREVFPMFFFSPTVFLSEHFIVYGNSISGESKVSGLSQSNLMTIDACYVNIDAS